MKLSTLILIITILHVSAATLAQKVTLAEKNAPLIDVFSHIRSQTGYDFVFAGSDLKDLKTVTINVKSEELTAVLNKIFEGQPLQYTIEDKLVTVEEKKAPSLIEKVKAAFAQVTITGKVQDETGQPLIGVNITIKGTSRGVATDSKGTYAITVPDEKNILVFSMIGYESQEFTAKELQSGSTITLKASTTNLKEIVVSKGYYNTTQELNTGNVVRISGEEIARQPVGDPMLALEGRVPGLFIQQPSGVPGSNPIIQIRGQNSLRQGNSPLFIVDGVPYPSNSLTNGDIGTNILGGGGIGLGQSPFNTIEPANIESIDILKDADATAIYGSRGSNGVILITTKQGKPGKPMVNIDASEGVGHTASKLDLMNTQQYLDMRRQALKNDGLLPGSGDYDINGTWDVSRNTDWQKVFTGNAAQYTNIQGSLSGGTPNLQYNLGGGYRRETTVFPGAFSDQKASGHINLKYTSTDQKFRINFSANYTNDNSDLPGWNFAASILMAPNAPSLYNTDGGVNWAYNSSGVPTFEFNPIGYTLQKHESVSDNLLTNIQLSYELFSGLDIKASLGYNKSQMNESDLTPASVFYGPADPLSRRYMYGTSNNIAKIFEPQISYTTKISKGSLNALVGMTQQQNDFNSGSYFAAGFTSDAFISNPSLATYFFLNGTNSISKYKYAALYARVNYNWEDKYLLNFTARRDGSSRFGPGQQFGNFGAVGAAWIFTKEKFLADLSWLSFGKVRASYGVTGNDQIGDYQYLTTYSAYGTNYQGIATLYTSGISNPIYGWESNKKLEGGIDLGFLGDRVFLTLDYFRNRSGNQLLPYNLSNVSGFNSVITNLPAVVQNTGLELQLSSINVKGKTFSWSSSFNITFPNNKLISYPDLSSSVNANAFVIGQPLSTRKVFHFTGIDSQTGQNTFQDVNGDGVLNSADQIAISATQKFYGGLSNTFVYKNWRLETFLQFVKQTGNNYYSSFTIPGFFASDLGNLPVAFQNSWKQPDDQAQFARLSSNNVNALNGSDASISDASYIRLKNVELSYQLPGSWREKFHVRSAKVFMQAQNLLTITNYQGLDPENQSVTSVPPLRMITAGLNIGF